MEVDGDSGETYSGAVRLHLDVLYLYCDLCLDSPRSLEELGKEETRREA